MVAIDNEIKRQIIDIILSHKCVEKIVIFGSRSCEEFKKTSDIDIAIWAKAWTGTDVNLVLDRLEENVNTPLRFDLVNYYDLTKEKLKTEINEKGNVIYESK